MQTEKQKRITKVFKQIQVLGLEGADSTRLAKRIVEGKQSEETYESHLFVLANSCRDSGDRFLARFCGGGETDLVVYGPAGFAIVDYRKGDVEHVAHYPDGESFETATQLFY